MPIAVSACLLGRPCRYDGKSKPSQDVIDYVEGKDIVAICPEVMGGLSIPHPPHEITAGQGGASLDGVRVLDETGKDGTEAFCRGAQRACEVALSHGCDKAILKAKSPSCGVGRVYDGTFSETLVEGDGLATRLMKQAGIVVATEKDFREVFAE